VVVILEYGRAVAGDVGRAVLNDVSVMVVATDGHRYVGGTRPDRLAERDITVMADKDALKYASSAKDTLDVMSNGNTILSREDWSRPCPATAVFLISRWLQATHGSIFYLSIIFTVDYVFAHARTITA
jgi:hypothetical protein